MPDGLMQTCLGNSATARSLSITTMSLYLASKDTIVKTAEEALWMLLGKEKTEGEATSEGGGGGKALSDVKEFRQPPKIQRAVSFESPLHALVIGIDRYASRRISNLRGCVADADAVSEYLQTSLSVPAAQIVNLRNDEATRSEIIAALQRMSKNPEIKQGDPLFIFFAGHGASGPEPKGWSTRSGKISLIVPHDCFKPGPDGQKVHAIADRSLGSLFAKLAENKGDNITVVFDCCHSGSGTRESQYEPTRLVRQIIYDEELPESLDSDIFGDHAKRAAAPVKTAGLSSHVLLAACRSDEVAGEERGRGLFTRALLSTLQAVGAEKVTYADLQRRLPDLPGQNPQFEGTNVHRQLFNARAPDRGRALYRLNQTEGEYWLEAGLAHGITSGTQFAVYPSREFLPTDEPLGKLVSSEPEAFKTKMSLLSSSDLPFVVPGYSGYALQISASQEEALRLYVPLQDGFLCVFEAVAADIDAPKSGHRAILLVDESSADLSVALADDGRIQYNLSAAISRYGLSRLYHTSEPVAEEIGRVLQAAAHFFWHSRRSPKAGLLRDAVDVQMNALESTEDYDFDFDTEVYAPVGENLLQAGVCDVEVLGELTADGKPKGFDSSTVYGITLKNKTEDKALYLGLFYFDCSDLSIAVYYHSPEGTHAEPSLPPGGVLPVGYGDGGGQPYSYYLREGQERDVGFLRLFLSEQPIHFTGVAQPSPFEPKKRQASVRGAEPMWDALTFTVIQNKKSSIQT